MALIIAIMIGVGAFCAFLFGWLPNRPEPPRNRPGISCPAPRAPRPPMPGNVPVARRSLPSTRRSS
jgi:hypothetical protein